MKRILIPAGGALLATGMLAAGLASTASAASDVSHKDMAKSAATAKAVANFWMRNNGAALRAAKQSNVWDDKTDVDQLQTKGGYSADTKPGQTEPIGSEKKSTAQSQNVNVPKTLGKVFFVNSKGEKQWCSASSIQSNYRNLVATAGHCVYDTANNVDTMDKWVFVPGYYQGKAPWGIYVGKQAFTHYDFDVYEDYDRDYAFVTVYNGVNLSGKVSKVLPSEYKTAVAKGGTGYVKSTTITKDEFDAGYDKYGDEGPFKSKIADPKVESVAMPSDAAANIEDYIKGKDGVQLTGVEVSSAQYNAASKGNDNGNQFERLSTQVPISQEEYNSLKAAKGDGKFLGTVSTNTAGTAWFKQQYFVKKWVKATAQVKYWVEDYYLVDIAAKDAGRLGDNVGGQGVAWNTPLGKDIRVFGYPAAAHPDGNKPFTGVTPKWCYGNTAKTFAGSAAKKIDKHVSMKCSMTEGADGGPWLYKYSNTKRLGYINGVTSTFNDQDENDRVDAISSPVFDGETKAVYDAARASWSGKIV